MQTDAAVALGGNGGDAGGVCGEGKGVSAQDRRIGGMLGVMQDRVKHADDLEVRVKQLEYENHTLEKNYKHHICDF